MIDFLPEHIEDNVDEFKVKVLINKISCIVSKYDIDFDDDDYFLSFLLKDINVKLNIDYIFIFENAPNKDYFSWLSNYIDKVDHILGEGGDILSSLSHVSTVTSSCSLTDYQFLSWGILNSNIDLLSKV